MSRPAIELRDLTHAYADGTQALRGISLHIAAGESVGILGANGAGKSTLLQHLNGLLLPSSGGVFIEGLEVTRSSLATVRQRVGLVFQQADDQLFMPTVRDDVAFGPRNQGLAAAEVERRVAQALDAVGASHLAERAPWRLSGGQKRSVALAGVLAMGPSILVLDEPSTGLDPAGRRRLIERLRELPQTRLVASHDFELVRQTCARVVVLHDGTVQADGSTAEVLADADLLARCRLS